MFVKSYFRQGSGEEVVKLPVKWMAPESLSDGHFSEKSDVVCVCACVCLCVIMFDVTFSGHMVSRCGKSSVEVEVHSQELIP